jgi:hypothetical protein
MVIKGAVTLGSWRETMKFVIRPTLVGLWIAAGVLVVGGTSAQAFSVSAEDGDEAKFYANKPALVNGVGTATFDGSVGKNNATDFVDVMTNSTLKIDNGYGEIKPSSAGLPFTSITFTPTAGNLYDGMFWRGQIVDVPCVGRHCTDTPFDGNLTATITDTNGVVETLTYTGIGIDADFTRIGFEGDLTNQVIQSVTLSLDSTGYFKSVKQIDFSLFGTTGGGGGGAAPLPGALPLFATGLGAIGLLGWRRKRNRTAALAA